MNVQWRSNERQWGVVLKTLHWLMALMVIGLASLGWIMKSLPTAPQKIQYYALHKSFGLTLLALAVLRLTWRIWDRGPASPAAMPQWQVVAARATHIGLYIVLIAMPLSGWLFNSAANFPLSWFGVFKLPSLTGGADPDLKVLAGWAHWSLFWFLALLFTLHVGAALKHHWVDRDEVLRRMLPGRQPIRAEEQPTAPSEPPV